jgi:hypothetical protein
VASVGFSVGSRCRPSREIENEWRWLPLGDPLTRGSAGNHPLRLYDSTDTLVCLKNVTDQPRKYKAYLCHPEGDCILAKGAVDPHQVSAFDIGRLRSEFRVPSLEWGVRRKAPSDGGFGDCPGRGSNPHGPFGPQDFKSRASGVSATRAS